MTKYWLGVVHRAHVLIGVEGGFVQTNHGAKGGMLKMQPGDGFVFYSPKVSYPDGAALREFTAIGRVADGEAYQGEIGDARPWRRDVHFDTSAAATPITPLLDVLELTRGNRNWGFIMRRGQVELTLHDFAIIAEQMGSTTLEL